MIFTTKQTGDKGEAYAAKYLKKHKYKIIARNYKKPYGEIDIIAENKEVIAFVEVKTRKENSLTQSVDAVNRKKQMKILNAYRWLWTYWMKKQLKNCLLRPSLDMLRGLNWLFPKEIL